MRDDRGKLTMALGAGALGGAAAATLFGLVDALAAGRHGATSPGLFLLAVSLYVSAAVPLGLALSVAGVAATLTLSPAEPLFRRLRGQEHFDRALCAGLAAFAICVAFEVGLVYLFARGPAATMSNPRLSALSTGLVAGAGAGLQALIFFPLYQISSRLTRALPRHPPFPLTVVFVIAGAAGLAGAALIVLRTLDWRVLRLTPWVVFGLLVCAIVFSIRLALRLSRARRGLTLAAGVALGVGAMASAPLLGRSERAVSTAQEGLLLPQLVALARGLTDRDGDGHSAAFSGGDCDDRNPAVHPGAKDLPGNGIDENCRAGDARPRLPLRASRPRAAPARRPAHVKNVLLICVDTLRADVLGVMGHRGGLTPRMDALARASTLFARTYAQGPNTPQSFPSVFTSLYPSRVPWAKEFTGYPPLQEEAETVFEILREGGLKTTAFSSHFYFSEDRGIRQGFDEWDNTGATNIRDSNKDVASPRIVPRALAALERLSAAKRRFVMFVHLFEPHSTYVKHASYVYDKRGVAGLRQKYDHEVRFVDEWVGRLVDGLEATGLAATTAVVLFSDHGEAFGEHRFYFHGQALYDEVLRVPLLVKLPRGAPRRVERPVALIDVAPTILELVGIAAPESFQGSSLVPALLGAASPPDRPIGAVLLPYPAWPKGQQAVVLDGRYKALMRVEENRFEAYDLKADPHEQRDLSASAPELARTLKARFERFAEAEL